MKIQKNERMTYDRETVGKRIKRRRIELGWSRRYVADKTGIVEKYYADIERGTCGMSIETMLALAQLYKFTLDEFIYGMEQQNAVKDEILVKEIHALSPQEREYCTQLVYLFIRGLKEKAQD